MPRQGRSRRIPDPKEIHMRHTIVLVHGAFADSSSWDDVIEPLEAQDHTVIAAANPLRGLGSDAETVTDVVRSLDGPIILVGHSYGGSVISNVPADAGEITGVVYVAAFAPDTGESCFELSLRYPGSTLGDAVRPTPRSDGTTDLTIAPELFHAQFAADVPSAKATRMAVTQRPVTVEALQEPSGPRPLWRDLPAWFVFGEEDRNIPAELEHVMARRAKARRIVAVPHASHALPVSRPETVVHPILEAAATPVPA
jgi:pimeloyl-ACP methyl ester carboxylesterase